MKKKLLLEIGVEEIPARFLYNKEQDFLLKFEKYLKDSNISYEKAEFFATPRRLVFYAEGLEEFLPKVKKIINGPPKNIAFDVHGEPTKAYYSFIERNNIEDPSQIKISEDKKQVLYIEREEGGERVITILKDILKNFIASLSFPKQMRWGKYQIRFVRPIRWILALFDSDVVEFNYKHLKSNRLTKGARFRGNREVEVLYVDEYFEKLKEEGVIVNQQERYNKIKKGLEDINSHLNTYNYPGDELIWENVYLGEYCNVGYNKFDEKYLKLPDRVLATSIAVNQKYFTFYDKDDNHLLSFYAFVYEQDEKNIENVKKGTLKVLRARLNDALFFFNEDLKLDFKALKEKLKGVKFQEELGSVYDKVERVKNLFYIFEKALNVSKSEKSNIEQILELFKNDLVTNMVSEKEFTSLQGYMGRIYAKANGYNDVVSVSIEEHYYPRFSGDKLPQYKEGQIVAIFDKMDTIAGLFLIKKIPTGSNDPYGLRRNAIGIIRILIESEFNISLSELIEKSLVNYNREDKIDDIKEQVQQFFEQRIESVLQERGYSVDLIQSVMSLFFKDFKKALNLLDYLTKLKSTKDFEILINSSKRINNILLKNKISLEDTNVNPKLFEHDEEKDLYDLLVKTEEKLNKVVEIEEQIEMLVAFAPLLERFFDQVMVMADDEEIRTNRLKLLVRLRDLFNRDVDFSKISYDVK